jgi:exosome complex RNA-binding protein Csl4
MGIKIKNNAYGVLASDVADSDLQLSLVSSARLPTLPEAGDYFYATLVNTSNELEIVKVTGITGNTLTIVRAQEGTTARAYATSDRLELRVTAQTVNDYLMQNAIAAQEAQEAAEAAAAIAQAVEAGNAVLKDGSVVMTGDLDFDGNKAVGLADGVADADAATVGQVNAAIDAVVESVAGIVLPQTVIYPTHKQTNLTRSGSDTTTVIDNDLQSGDLAICAITMQTSTEGAYWFYAKNPDNSASITDNFVGYLRSGDNNPHGHSFNCMLPVNNDGAITYRSHASLTSLVCYVRGYYRPGSVS